MKKLVKFIKIMVPVLAFLGVASACNKEECCTWTDSFGDTYSYCEDGQWAAAGYTSWNEVRAEAAYYGGKCKK